MIINYIKIKREMRNIKLKKYCCTGDICVKVLDYVNLLIEGGEFVAAVGLLGCGRITLLNILGRIG